MYVKSKKRYNYYSVMVRTTLSKPYREYVYPKIIRIKREGVNVVFYESKTKVYRHPLKNLKEIVARHVETGKYKVWK